MDDLAKDKLFRDFMALPGDGERVAFVADYLFRHGDGLIEFVELAGLDKAEALHKKRIETLKKMVCEKAGMPEIWETFSVNFVRLVHEARARMEAAEREKK